MEIVERALERLFDLEIEERFIESRKEMRKVAAKTFATNLEIIQKYGSSEEKSDLRLFLNGLHPKLVEEIIQTCPNVVIDGCREVEFLKARGLINLYLSKNSEYGSKAKLAKELGFSRAYISLLEKNKRTIKLDVLIRVLNLAGYKLCITSEVSKNKIQEAA
ncbi:helix-turn-helix transcriptional regulator [Halobacteriovorax sp. GB3]|uniref:helix-turn-helix domain-containing protein n=1 Tax=Halobacteriovorax sp. GB3 TaxID=2719615 RepID=UPI0023620527|nr:helix-turn-helix transcriptional regulator [Halobacteriovorax sp. GB3]MDD0853008.1 helix-turn-helix transcriptional regulator [Halobacteriovorax sp. GB3]